MGSNPILSAKFKHQKPRSVTRYLISEFFYAQTLLYQFTSGIAAAKVGASGAAIGSAIMSGVGTAIGGLAGIVAGFFTGALSEVLMSVCGLQ